MPEDAAFMHARCDRLAAALRCAWAPHQHVRWCDRVGRMQHYGFASPLDVPS
jgi:hypothetical protein